MKKYKINKGHIIEKLENKIIIFDGEKSVLYTLNETASFIFRKIRLSWEKEKIITSLIEKYGIKREKAQVDFEDLLKDLLSKKIITKIKE